MSKLITLIALFHVLAFTAIAQGTSKPISREQLVYYLSQAINIQGLTDYCKTSTGLYPGPLDTNSYIVDNNELSANPWTRGRSYSIRTYSAASCFNAIMMC